MAVMKLGNREGEGEEEGEREGGEGEREEEGEREGEGEGESGLDELAHWVIVQHQHIRSKSSFSLSHSLSHSL